MKRLHFILFVLILPINLLAQVVYDTIPNDSSDNIIGGWYVDDFMIFKDYSSQIEDFYKNVDFSKINDSIEKVYVYTTFGKSGKLKNTKILKSTGNKYCDSIAFQFVNELDNWLPGLQRGKFVDISMAFPIIFDNSQKSKKSNDYYFLNASEDEFNERKEYFEFIYNDSSQKVLNNFSYFIKFLAEQMNRDSLFIYYWEYSRPQKKDRVRIDLQNKQSDNINFIVYYLDHPTSINYILAKERFITYWDNDKWSLTPNFAPVKKNGIIYLEKNREMILIGFKEGTDEPELAILNNLTLKNDTTLSLNFKRYTKQELLKKLKYSP